MVAASVVETHVIDRTLCNCIFHIVDMHVLRSILCTGLVACRVDSRDILVITKTNCDYTAGVVNLSEIISVGLHKFYCILCK